MSTLTISQAADYLGYTPHTLRRWEREGRLSPVRSFGKHRRYTLEELDALRAGKHSEPAAEKPTLIYARVSSHDQKADLARQTNRLRDFCTARGWVFDVVEDIGSGLNYKKKGLHQVLDAIQNKAIQRLVIAHKDRLLRFGAELVFDLCEHNGVEVVIVEQSETSTFEQELVEDVLELVTVVAARLYGARSHKAQQAITAVKQVLQ